MVHRVFVKVLGFTDVERHALNTVFRLSEQGQTAYTLWMPGAPEAARLALIDGESYEARLEIESPSFDRSMRVIWIGPAGPANAWRTFGRPLDWPRVVQAMDELFGPPSAQGLELDFDLGTGPAPLQAEVPGRRALIVNAQREERLYLRARLVLAGLLLADEAATASEALGLLNVHSYEVAVLDTALPDMDGWRLLKQLSLAKPAIPHLILSSAGASWSQSVRAWFGGARACLGKPLQPEKLQSLLQKI